MNMSSDPDKAARFADLETILDALDEINVQLRCVLQSSKEVIGQLELRSRNTNEFAEILPESKNVLKIQTEVQHPAGNQEPLG